MLKLLQVLSFSLSLSLVYKKKTEQLKTHLKNCNGYSWGIFYMNFAGKFPNWNKISFRTPTALRLRKAVRLWKTNEIVPRSLILPQRNVLMFSMTVNQVLGKNEAD